MKLNKLEYYLKETFGVTIRLRPLNELMKAKLPIYLGMQYNLYLSEIGKEMCVFAEINEVENFSIAQIEKQFEQLRNLLGMPVVAIFAQLEAFNRKRLIAKRIGFIVPGKQIYIPDMLIDIKDFDTTIKRKNPKITPTGQLILLYHILIRNKEKQVEHKTFKELAVLFDTNAMAITRAVNNFKELDLCDVEGGKEKYIRFKYERAELWDDLYKRKLLVNPVQKRVFVDDKPKSIFMLYSNESALPEYSDMNPSRQEYYAVEKTVFYRLQKKNELVDANNHEGQYCLEIWKYNPSIIVNDMFNDRSVVDPLSLYLSLKDRLDERVEMALEQIIEKFIW